LESADEQRTVTEVTYARAFNKLIVTFALSKNRMTYCVYLNDWRKWAQSADIIKDGANDANI